MESTMIMAYWGCLSWQHSTMWTIEEPSILKKDKIRADIPSRSETIRCWHLLADVECPSLVKISNLPTLVVSINTERHDVIRKCTWWHKDGGDLIWWFLETSMQIDRNKMNLHDEYDYQEHCQLYPLLSR